MLQLMLLAAVVVVVVAAAVGAYGLWGTRVTMLAWTWNKWEYILRKVERSCGVLNRVDHRLMLKWLVTSSNSWSTCRGPCKQILT